MLGIRGFAALSLILLSPISSSAESLDVIFSHPTCQAHVYANPLPTFSGGVVPGKAANSYCTEDDYDTASIKSAPSFVRLKALIDDTRNTKFVAAYFIFSEDAVVDAICQRHIRSPISMTLFLQQGSIEPNAVAQRVGPNSTEASARKLQACLGPALQLRWVGCGWFVPGIRCPQGKISTLHHKYWRFEGASQDVSYVLGSGNIGQSLYANFDNWNFVATTRTSALDSQLRCMIEPIQSSTELTERILRSEYQSCLRASKAHGLALPIASMLMPATRLDFLLSQLDTKLADAETITLITQDIGGKQIANFLSKHAIAGRTVRILLGDDWYWSSFGLDVGVARTNKVRWLEELVRASGGRIVVRYLELNHHSSFRPSLHHKLLVAKKSNGLQFALVTTSNWDDASFRGNLETVHFINDPKWAVPYVVEADRLWSLAMEAGGLPIVDVQPPRRGK